LSELSLLFSFFADAFRHARACICFEYQRPKGLQPDPRQVQQRRRRSHQPCFRRNSASVGPAALSLQVLPDGAAMPRSEAMQTQGEITKYRDDIGFGVIVADNGRKYRFTKSDIINSASRLIGLTVDFVVVANRPTDIILLIGSQWTIFGSPSHS
jgi:hypothetical protein